MNVTTITAVINLNEAKIAQYKMDLRSGEFMSHADLKDAVRPFTTKYGNGKTTVKLNASKKVLWAALREILTENLNALIRATESLKETLKGLMVNTFGMPVWKMSNRYRRQFHKGNGLYRRPAKGFGFVYQ